jgi:hypothetical protein
MTLQDIQQYTPISNLFTGMLSISAVSYDFATHFKTFAPEISAEITSYEADQTSASVGKITLYTELYKSECAEFLYNYTINNDLTPVLQNLMTSTLLPIVNLSGKIAKININDWYSFSAKVANAQFRNFSTQLSGDNVLVFFI